MTRDNEYYKNGIEELENAIAAGIADRDEMNRATRNLIHFYIKLEEYDTATSLMKMYFNFNRRDLLINLANLCKATNSPALAEELIGEIRCFSYVWMEFCVEMQELYTNLGETEKAEALQHNIVETAFMSMRPATKALMRSLAISGNITDSMVLKNLYKEVKRIHKELA